MLRYDNNKIKRLREYEGLDQKEFSKRLGVTVATISRWERGERIPKISDIARICNVYKVTPEYFFIQIIEKP